MAFCPRPLSQSAAPSWKINRNLLMTAAVLYVCIPVMVTAFSVRDVVGGQRMIDDIVEQLRHNKTYSQQQYDHVQQQQQQQYEQQQQLRHKRAVRRTLCKPATNLEAMFRKINSELNITEFLGRTWGGLAISIPKGEHGRLVPNSRHHRRCPASLNHHDSQAPLAERQLCPHYDEVVELAEGYFPPVLKKAVCKCRYCIENDAYRCIPVRTSVWVLKPAGCFLGMQRYVEEEHHINTSCACAV